MDLDAGCKNNRIANNDVDEEEEQMDNNFEEDDEPDFMDNSGKCWEFTSKIRDEKHLKEWCQNKMGGMIVGKEEKLTRQFHCPNKECQFKAIFLKSCSNVYTRNKHNHAVKKAGNIRREWEGRKNLTPEQGYCDKYGKLWHFHAHIGKNISKDKLLKFGFIYIQKKLKTLNLYCRKSNPDGGRCPFVGIYLKSNGYLYTRGEHEHSKRKKTPQNEGDDYIDQYGKIWKFNKKIGKNIQQEMLQKKFGFSRIETKGKGLYLRCEIQRRNKNCKFAGIYLKSNGCLYTRGMHNHEQIEKNPKPNDGDSYTDRLGRLWPFHSKIGKQQIPNGIWLSKFGFTTISRKQQTLNLYCQKKTTNGGKCPIRGRYLMSNGCLYMRGKHEHKYN